MKKLYLLIVPLFFTILFSFAVQAQEVLTNQNIVDMLKLGLSDDIIITKIKTSDHNVNF